jgi:diguanylate cyclase (GGDEF)-like protein/PAS domain S-box-containing protein
MVMSLYEILIIDDTESNIRLLKSILERQGDYQIKTFKDPLKAADYISQHNFDLALIDYNMPHMNGIELINVIRHKDHCRYQPLIMITSEEDQNILYDALTAGANDFLRKPIDQTEFLARVHNRLSLWEKYKQLQEYTHGLEDTVDVVSKKLKNSEEKFSLILEGTSDGVWDWNISKRSITYSPSWARTIGFTESEIPPIIASWLNRVHPEDLDRLTLALDAHIHNGKQDLQCEYRLRHRNGHYLWMLCRAGTVRREGGVATRIAGSQIDISHLKIIQEQLTKSAFHDNLTGLPNRALFLERLDRAFVRYRRNPKQHLAIVFLDFDKYKQINDTYGHNFGDDLLREITPRLLSVCREMDTVARFGGDEFVILLNEVDSIDDVNTFIKRLIKQVSEPLTISGIEINASISLGVAVANKNYQSAEQILQDADVALYHAKKGGRSRSVFFDADLRIPLPKILEIKTSLAQAIKNDEMKMFYQPIYDLNSKKIVGLEALIRWQHPRLGLVSPNDFIPIAEEDEVILNLGNFVISTCFNQLATWYKKFPHMQDTFLSLNFTKRQLMQKDFFNNITQYAQKYGIDPSKITIEISEANFIEIEAQHSKLLWRLRKTGFNIGLDNYGVPQSSISTLVRFPFDLVKVDRLLMVDIDKDKEYQYLFKLVGSLCRELKIPTVIEGVQTKEIYDLVATENFGLAQGYYLSRPIPPEQIDPLLKTNKMSPLKKKKSA